MADVKLSELPAASAVTTDDLVEITNDPGGTPVSQKATAAQIATFVASSLSLSVAQGGTGIASATANGVLLGNTTSPFQVTAAGASNQILRIPSGGGAPSFGQVNVASSAAVVNALQVTNGGTGGTTQATALSGLGIPFTPASASGPATLALAEDTDNGTNTTTISAPASVTSNRVFTLPDVATGAFTILDAAQTVTNKTIAFGSNTVSGTKAQFDTAVTDGDHVWSGDTAGGVLGGTYPNPSFAVDMATQTELDAHVNNTTAAHVATAIGYTGTGILAGVDDVAEALDALATGTEIEDLPAATEPDGTELVPGVQSSAGVTFTTDQLVATPADVMWGPSRTRQRAMLDPDLLSVAATTTTATEIGRTFWQLVHNAGAGIDISNDSGATFTQGNAGLNSGTVATNRVAMVPHGVYIYGYNQADHLWFACRAQIVTVSTAGEQFEVRLGYVAPAFTGTPTDGLFFRAQHGDTNWEAVTMDDTANVTATDTGVAINTSVRNFSIEQDGTTVRFYIDGSLVATQATNRPDDSTVLTPGAGLFKAVGTTERTVRVDAITFDNPESNRTFARFR